MAQNKRKQNKKTAADSFTQGADQMLGKAQNIINSAVNVLEEEIAAGILAAKRIEKKLIDVDELRDDPDDLMNRFRHDTHEAVDLVMDAFEVLLKQMKSMVESIRPEGSQEVKKTTPQEVSNQVLFLEVDKEIQPGGSTKLQFCLAGEASDLDKNFHFKKADLIGTENRKINLRALQVHPMKGKLKQESNDFEIQINIPKNAEDGVYNSFLTDKLNPSIRIIISLKVKAQ